jgi:hypothetical protein
MLNVLSATVANLTMAVSGAVLLAACNLQQPQDATSDNRTTDEEPVQPLPIVIEPPFNRSRLLLTVERAASAHSAGLNDTHFQRMLNGKQFEVRIRFGCDGQGPIGEHGWSVDPDGQTLRLRAVPTLSLDDDVSRIVAPEGVEAVEGFWLTRPWLLQAACPAGGNVNEAGSKNDLKTGKQTVVTPANASPAVQRIGIAQFFSAEDSRTHRRIGRPFEAVRQLEEGERVGANGFDLVLSGRLRASRDGRVILCAGSGRDRPPDCIISAAIDRVRIESPDDKRLMAEWSV